MTNVVKADPALITPERWSGIDISDPSYFDEASGTPGLWLSTKQERVAALDLTYVLAQVVGGDYTEVKPSIESRFAPSSDTSTDGTVVLIDHEYLMKYIPKKGYKGMIGDDKEPTLPVQPPYGRLWVEHVRKNEEISSNIFGQEGARFPEDNILYGRYISWGVILTHKDGTRAIANWALCAPKISTVDESIRVPLFGRQMPRRADVIPIDIAQATAHRELDLLTSSIRTVSRVSDIRVVYPAAGNREHQPSLADRMKAAKGVLGQVLVPKPSPTPI